MRSLVLHGGNFGGRIVVGIILLLPQQHLRKSVVGHSGIWLSLLLVIEARCLLCYDQCAGLLWIKPMVSLHLRHLRADSILLF